MKGIIRGVFKVKLFAMSGILAINVGSSTFKFALFHYNGMLQEQARGSFKNIGQGDGAFKYTIENNSQTRNVHFEDQGAALQFLVSWLSDNSREPVNCITHRLVHGGPDCYQPQIVDEDLMNTLRKCIPFAPDHLPNAIDAITTTQKLYTNAVQVACFDTAFHQNMPPQAKTLPLGNNINHNIIHKYGFHGLSYEYICAQLDKLYDDIKQKKIVIAHLGNGASMAAIQNGICCDTTMGFTPSGGLVMGTRSGDIDPGVLIYLLQYQGYTAETLNELINHKSGLEGISGLSSDMQILLQNAPNHPRAQLAIDIFCYQATKHLGSLIAAMGGIDVLVFTGGIGQAAPLIRERICNSMGFAGIQLSERYNLQNAAVISAKHGSVIVHVIITDEEKQMAMNALKLIEPKK